MTYAAPLMGQTPTAAEAQPNRERVEVKGGGCEKEAQGTLT